MSEGFFKVALAQYLLGGVMAERNWREYNEKLIRKGELYISLDFLKNWDKELEKMNFKKRGRPYKFPESFILFLAFIHVTFLPYRQLEGFLRKTLRLHDNLQKNQKIARRTAKTGNFRA